MNYVITYAILAAVTFAIIRADMRRCRKHEARAVAGRASRQYPLCVTQAGADADLQRITDAIRHEPPAEKLPPRIARDPCGCLWFAEGLWSPCRADDPDLAAASIALWEAELEDHQ